MIRSTFKFSLPVSDRYGGSVRERWEQEIQTRVRPLVDETWSHGDYEIDLESSSLPTLIEVLEDLHAQKVARLNGALEERVVDDEQAQVEWFLLDPQGPCDFGVGWDLREPDPLPPQKADRVKPGLHVLGYSEIFVSERAKALVEEHGLTGVELLRIPDNGRYRAPQWYLAVAREPLGRGLDHPWFDPATLTNLGYQTRNPRSRHGQWGFGSDQFRRGVGFGEPVKDRLLAIALSMAGRRGSLGLRSCRRLLRAFLPSTDFAFVLWDAQQGPPSAGASGELLERRGLAVNRRTRDLLLAQRLLGPEECMGALVLDAPYEGAEELDRLYGPPDRLFSDADLARHRDYEAAGWAEFQANPKPVRVPDLKRSLALLRAAKRREPAAFARPAGAKAISEAERALGQPIPPAWQEVLRASNAGRIESCELADGEGCELVAVEALARARDSWRRVMQSMDFDAPTELLPVIETEIGDVVCLDTAALAPDGDCPVALVSHETGEREREWASVAEFLEELLAGE